MIEPVGVGIIGCGNISRIYLKNCTRSPYLKVIACADLVREKAEARAEEFGIEALDVDELLADPAIELVINLTVPTAHAEVALQVLEAGKSVYNEKPLAINIEEAKKVLAFAGEKGCRVGCAPDTFLGAGLQTSRKLIDDGWIGEPVAATAFVVSPGPERWHPNPFFFYEVGGGPLFDMGPYYLTALVHLLGPMKRVTGAARITREERVATSKTHFGTRIPVHTPTHIAGTVEFARGSIATLITSFDVWSSNLPRLEIYGTEGTLSVPDPNTFGGPVRIRRAGAEEWSDIPFTHAYEENSRGLGVIDMALAIRQGGMHRANGDLAFHVLEAMESILTAADTGRHVTLTSECEQPEPMPMRQVYHQPWIYPEG